MHALALLSGGRRVGVLNALVIGIALSIPATGYGLLEGLRSVGGRLSLDPQVTVFLPSDAKRAEAEALGARLRKDTRLSSVRFLSREEALKELGGVQGLPELLAALGRNPLPDAFVVTPAGGPLEALAEDLRKLPGVAHVQADALWARRLAALAGVGRLGLWLLAALLGGGLVALAFNTVRLQILTQRDEIEVSALLGATHAFIRRPFYYLGFLQGVAGGVLAVAVSAGFLALLNREVRTLAETYASDFRFPLPATPDAVAVVLFAGLLGWLGAHLSVTRHLHAIEPR